jgi:4-diphosphocytidyl-2-C-methyl-D-erythritol kinase
MSVLVTEPAPAKINLCLFLGPTRADGRHQLLTLFDSLTLCDELEIAEGESDQVICDGVDGPNLVTGALSALRAAGWHAPALRVRIRKRIPIAAGMGGGSADAAAMLRLAPRLAPVADETLTEIAIGLGADVPGQLRPGPSLATGAGENVEPLPPLPPYGVLVLPQPFPLSTADVYRQADRLGLPRRAPELASLQAELTAALPAALPSRLIVNDLQPAALSLRVEVGEGLTRAVDAGADHAIVCGSGPTALGIFWGHDGPDRAAAAVTRLRSAHPGALATQPVGRGVRSPTANE